MYNQAQINKRAVASLLSDRGFVSLQEALNKDPIGSIFDLRMIGKLRCVQCQSYNITVPVIKYFNYDVTRVLCYDCQGMETLER